MKIVNFGCGSDAVDKCLNVDGSVTVLLAKLPFPAWFFGSRARFIVVIRDHRVKFGSARSLRFPQRSLDGFYTSHTLEHLSRGGCEDLLGRVREWLKPGGVLRVVLPDLKRMAAAYVCGKMDADTFITRTRLANRRSDLRVPFGHSEHRWMYDCDSFIALLRRLKYCEIQNSSFGSSRLPELAGLDVAAREATSFYVEAMK